MSIAPKLPPVIPMFMQECPLCGRSNRMVVQGVYEHDGKRTLHADIGYSFCNCKAIFYTRYENVKEHNVVGFQYFRQPLVEFRAMFKALLPGDSLKIVMPDPFFIDWGSDPYAFLHWKPRLIHTIWQKDAFEDECRAIGFEIISSRHDFELGTENPQTMELILRKP